MINFMDENNYGCILHFSHKSCRVTHSRLPEKNNCFCSDAFDDAFILKYDLRRILNRPVPLSTMTDSKLLFDAIAENRFTTDNRLIVDVGAVREA